MRSSASIFCILVYATCVASTCPPGNYVYNGSCQACPKGMFQDEANQEGCKPCQGNTVATEPGSTICEACQRHSTAAELKHECACNNNALVLRAGGKCQVCKRGFWKLDYGRRGAFCEECQLGTFSPTAGLTECKPCPDGTISKQSGTKCVRCREGEYVNKNEKCAVCGLGSGRRDNKCKKCKPGEFSDNEDFQACLPCPPGSFSHAGASRCTKCPPGKRLMKHGCGSCAAGERYDAMLRECVKCKVNTFMPYRNTREECFACAGDAVAVEGSKKCTSCRGGAEAHRKGRCVECKGNSIYDIYERRCSRCGVNAVARQFSEACVSCDTGSFSLAQSNECFTCPRGQALIVKKGRCGRCPPGKTYRDYSPECHPCEEGTVKPATGVHACTRCESGMTSNTERTACIVA